MLILLLISVVLAYILQQKIYERYWNHSLDISVKYKDPYVYEGQNSALIEEITNDKILPLTAVEVRLGVSKKLIFSGEATENSNVSDQSYRRDVFTLFSNTKIIRTLPFTATQRGYYQITRSEVLGSDFFFRREYHWQKPQETNMYVYPRGTDISRIRLICQTISGNVVRQSRLFPDPFEFSGIREYQQMDPMNHINWKASARSGDLMVNQFDSTTNIHLTLFLDTMDQGIIKYNELTEEGIRIAASLAAELDRKHMDLQVRGNGICKFMGEKEELSVFLKANAGKMQELNRKLALLDLEEPCEEFTTLLKKEADKKKTEQIYLLISRDEELVEKDVLMQLASHNNTVIWILPYLRQTGKELPQKKGITIMGWEVER